MIKPGTHFKDTLTEAETDFRRMCDDAPIFIWMSNVSGACFFFNKAWRLYTGRHEIENTDEWFEKIHPEERDSVYARFKKHFAARSPYRAEYRLRRHDGAYRWVISHAAPYYDSRNHFAGFISACFDFNDQHEFENTLATRALKQTALATYGRFALEPHKFGELTREAVNLILQTLHVDCSYLASINYEDLTLSLEASACRLDQKPPRKLGSINPDALSITRAMQLADDRENFPLAQLLAGNGIRSALMCPVGAGKQLYGYLFANTRTVRTFSPEAVDFLQGLANTLGTVHQRERAEKALAESEQKLLQSQKVEAIGLLAGGIAHDFNNLLTAIRGYTELLQKDMARYPDPEAIQALRTRATGIENAADRASKLVRRLLVFSRTQVARAGRIDINTLVLDLKDLIAAFLRSGIHLDVRLGDTPVYACVDRNQIEQVIVNLAINSRDAMPNGGRLAITVTAVSVDTAAHPTLEPGDYAQIDIADNGSGIPPEVRPKLFTPFFTTKPKNRGTGLGLPTCANIVKNARGKIFFDTTLGKGSTFTVLLPAFHAGHHVDTRADGSTAPFFSAPDAPPHDDATPPDDVLPPNDALPSDDASSCQPQDTGDADLPVGTETIILVEDDPAIRDVTTAILESLGYNVRAYDAGETLVEQYESAPKTLADARLLITDINMAGINGRQLVEHMHALRPDGLRVLYISGFINETVQKSGGHFLEKPFTRDVLAKKVREVLDS
jgi:PAS domain S-box-containing protein